MLQSLFKLFCMAAAMLGPFAAGIIRPYVLQPEIYAIFLVGGGLLGIAGLCGFASIERNEQQAHDRARFGRKL